MQQPHQSASDIRNLIIALVLSTAIMIGWQYFFAEPIDQAAPQTSHSGEKPALDTGASKEDGVAEPVADEAESPRIALDTDAVSGSINLRGLRFDELVLNHYKETIADDSPHVSLLQPAKAKAAYFAEFGWLAGDSKIAVPTPSTLWQSEQQSLSKSQKLRASWDNGQGVNFTQEIANEGDYLFAVTQEVTNNSEQPITLYPYGLINRRFDDVNKHFYILHEGPIGAFNEVLTELSYENLREDGAQSYKNSTGWLGITDKYWLTALIPDARFDGNISHSKQDNKDKYQVDYRGEPITIQPGERKQVTSHFFAGAKRVTILDRYTKMLNAPLLDRAVDFGTLYFLTKPIFLALHYFHDLLGNFGLAIMALTVCIKILLFPLANKSYKAMSQMKLVMPKITELRERYADDKIRMNQEIVELYKREKVNPASGCLPIVLQLPVFFALYKVIFVTIEMRHAPFYGWINDLSAPDPTAVFNLFGLIPWDPPQMLMIGAWPLIMCGTMIIQQRLNPKPADATQAAVMQWLPFIFLFLFAGFPAGLVIYWAWNNSLSIIQQWLIIRRHRASIKKTS